MRRTHRYFLYDTICCLLIDLDWANLLHHVCTMLGMAVGLVQGRVRGTAPHNVCCHRGLSSRALIEQLWRSVGASWCCASSSWRCQTRSCTCGSC